MDTKILRAIDAVYRRKTLADACEQKYRRFREKLFGVDRSIFDPTILYYKETQGKSLSHAEALAVALDRNAHKNAWFARDRKTVEDLLQFYQEVHIYPFRQPYLKRFGGFRWHAWLVKHRPNPAILEYGCGSAVLTEYLLQKFPHCQYTVADIPSVTLDFVKWKQQRFQYAYTILTIGSGKEGIPLQKNYDLIICQDVLEHTPNPLEIVTAFVYHLTSGGVLVIDFIDAPGGENLDIAAAQRHEVKRFLRENLLALKAIDEPGGNNGLYVKDGREDA
jgi:SAM-dependent methyltransferase